MKKVITVGRVPAKLWLDELEQSCLEQVVRLADLPFAFHHVAAMPDAHTGMGMPIGGVLATRGVVVPNAVGVDIGCGMCSVKTSFNADALTHEKREELLQRIQSVVPLGFDHHLERQDESLLPSLDDYDIDNMPIVKSQYAAALHQVGTLGGGNHFIEVQSSKDGSVYIMLHSGSRNVGKQVASHYDDIAKFWNEKWYSKCEEGLAFLPIEFDEAKKYLREMQYCIDFGFANRKLMMSRICQQMTEMFPDITFEPMINIAHNYAAWENHFGKNVLVHRKGATRAREGELCLIPGSQGTKSYIARGLGNKDSFCSCSHGAGRRMSRKEAIRTLNLKAEIERMERQGIVNCLSTQADLDEAASAYKDIDVVIANERDLVELSPLLVVKVPSDSDWKSMRNKRTRENEARKAAVAAKKTLVALPNPKEKASAVGTTHTEVFCHSWSFKPESNRRPRVCDLRL